MQESKQVVIKNVFLVQNGGKSAKYTQRPVAFETVTVTVDNLL